MSWNAWTCSVVAALCLTALPVAASHGHHGVTLEDGLKAASTARTGEFVKVEYLVVTPRGTRLRD